MCGGVAARLRIATGLSDVHRARTQCMPNNRYIISFARHQHANVQMACMALARSPSAVRVCECMVSCEKLFKLDMRKVWPEFQEAAE